MNQIATTETTTAEVKSPLLSKTNITAALLMLFTLLSYAGRLPEGYDIQGGAAAIVGAGSLLVIAFRTISRAVLRK